MTKMCLGVYFKMDSHACEHLYIWVAPWGIHYVETYKFYMYFSLENTTEKMLHYSSIPMLYLGCHCWWSIYFNWTLIELNAIVF